MSKINQDIHARVTRAMDEMNYVVKGRADVIHGVWVGRIGGLHVLMRGPGGTGKSMLSRAMAEHISDAVHFETALDETTDPSAVFGAPNIKLMAEEGKVARVVTDMLPEATDAFLDEFFNGNIPLLHSIMPVLNERIYHDGNGAIHTPLKQCLMGTNKFNLDPDLAALFDRVHIRYDVNYISDRDQKMDMVSQAIARLAHSGRGTATTTQPTLTTVTLAELDAAFQESLALDVDEPVFGTFFDLIDELEGAGIIISDRRKTDGFNAVLANAWLRNHESVSTGDFDILANMFWTHEEQITEARKIILSLSSPGDKVALDLLDELDKLKGEVRQVADDDPERKRRVCVEAVRNAEKLLREAEAAKDEALTTGSSTQRLDEVIGKADRFKLEVGADVFGLRPDDISRMQQV